MPDLLISVDCRLVHPAVESSHGGLYVRSVYVSSLFILAIPVGPTASKSTRPIFAKFARLLELWLQMINHEISFSIHEGTLS